MTELAPTGTTIAAHPPESSRKRAALIGGLVALILFLHYTLTRDVLIYHDMLRRSMYVPIILAAVWFGARSGVGVALAAAILYAPHLFFQHRLTPTQEVDRTAEMFLYVLVGGLTGLLVERERWQRRRTERALAEVRQAHANLELRSAQLAETQEALRQAERLSTLGEVAADLAHEIRNPLATLRGTVQILDGNPPRERRKEFYAMVLEEIDRLNGVVEGYLRAARAHGKTLATCDAVAAVESVLALARRQASRSAIRIERSGVANLPVVIDAGRLTQVFMNLALNAIQAMPNGGRLRVHCQRTPAERGRFWAEITFSDDGPGIPAGERDKIFQPFYTTRSAGTGLGLGIARRLVEEHGGSLTLEESTGATFRVRLPGGK